MAIAVTLLGSATFNTTSGTKTVTATPAVGDGVIIFTAHSGNTSTTAPTDDQGGTYSLIDSTFKNVSADGLAAFVRDSVIPANVSTVFTHAPGTTTGGGLAVLHYTGGGAGVGAIRQSAKEINKTAAGTPAPVFAATPKSTSAVVGAAFVSFGSAFLSPRSGYTERVDAAYTTPDANLEIMSRDSGEASATITWGSPAAFAYCTLVIELSVSQALTAAAFANSNSFPGLTVTPVTWPLSLAAFTNTNAFPTLTADLPGALVADVFVNTNTFGDLSLTLVLSAEAFVNTNTFGALSIGAVSNLTADAFVNENSFGVLNFTSWTIHGGDDTPWEPVVYTSALTDENGDPILDSGGDPITAEGDETWTEQSNNSTDWEVS